MSEIHSCSYYCHKPECIKAQRNELRQKMLTQVIDNNFKDDTTPPQRTEQEPVKIAHRHEWFRTGEMKVGQMRCISCGTWGHEEMPQRTWVGLAAEDRLTAKYMQDAPDGIEAVIDYIEAKLKEKNCAG